MLMQESRLVALRDQLLGLSISGTASVRYHLRSLLGEGGQGWVFKANYDEPDGIWVVVKVLRPESVTQDTLLRFRREAEVLRMLGSRNTPTPNVVRYYDHGVFRFPIPTISPGSPDFVDLPFTVLEYVDGGTLADLIESSPTRTIPIERLRKILRQVVRALCAVHEHRVVHRDLKPSNILIANQGGTDLVKVTDFGLVKLVDLKLTQTVAVAGASLGYAPPEQYEQGNERVSQATDVFSFAAILYESLSGIQAFPYGDNENPLRVIARMLTGPRPSLAASSAVFAPELRGQSDIIASIDVELARAFSADPAARQASCDILWDAVEPLLRMAHQRANPNAALPSNIGMQAPTLSVATPESPPSAARLTTPSVSPDVPRVCAADFTVRVLNPPVTGLSLRGCLIGGDGSMIAVGSRGLLRWTGRDWSALPTPAGLHLAEVSGITRTADARILLYGGPALAVLLSPSGQTETLSFSDPNLLWLGAHADSNGELILVGERRGLARAVAAFISPNRPPTISEISWAPRLHSVTRLNNSVFVACGDAGALVLLSPSGNTPINWDRTGHLRSICATFDGASVVGSGGHALLVAGSEAKLEAVETTRDLAHVCIGPDGAAWTVGASGRILRRERSLWKRIAPDQEFTSNLIAIGPTHRGMLALGQDGAVLEILLSRP